MAARNRGSEAMTGKLANKTAAITGAASGIGLDQALLAEISHDPRKCLA